MLGGGLVPGGVVLIGGEPGIGKSTLLLQALAAIGKSRKVLYVSGEESPQQIALRAQAPRRGRRRRDHLPRHRSGQDRGGDQVGEAGCRGDRLDPDAVFGRPAVGAGIGGAGARMRRAADPRRQERRDHHGVHRARDQGRHAGRSARARAHGGHGAVLRRRHALALPADPRLQEPLRRGERAGRVRHGGEGAERRRQSVRAVPVPARRRGRRLVRDGDAGRHAPDAGRDPGAGGRGARAQPAAA